MKIVGTLATAVFLASPLHNMLVGVNGTKGLYIQLALFKSSSSSNW
ncbi:Uncharacterised protein [Legionella wadsworthii]|uniref:Uncharacterized protein n=1 Tax=Legionella wadsworthii TaxID=28088 RepID=A0A378LMW5_9GAMM|nr:Uncharacterised protein [Legionella wadsworthii]